ncbi:hypothetical protein Dda_2487 [Drechslerella dactyloides]|uniref:Uncharacterized protein n=1 Tax=Drechslerella dactyloides TaxID=74499 RepID=A0AAD6IZL1_DREDA|nr:hypothetical protein Dda_2487 [Drechslerella dactyloides]
MSAALSPLSFLEDPSPTIPFYTESRETSRQLFQAATTPSPRMKRRWRDSARSTTPRPEDSRSFRSSKSPSRIFETSEDDDIFAPARDKGKGKEPQVPSGFGLGLGIPVLPCDSTVDEPIIAWRFNEVSDPSSATGPSSPSPTESIDGDITPVPPGDQDSLYTLTPGPAWPPPPSTDASPDTTPRNSLDVHDTTNQRESGGSTDFEDMPVSPMTPAITQLLDEISTMDRPPSTHTPKPVTTVQAWVMDMPRIEPASGRGQIRVRKMRSWRNLRALGTRTSQFEMIRKTASTHTLPSPPITPPGENARGEQRRGETEGQQQFGYMHTTPKSQLPDSPVENPFYDDYEDIIEAHLSPSDDERPATTAEQGFLADASPMDNEQPFQEWPREAIEEIQASRLAEEGAVEQATPMIPPPPAPESPVAGSGGMDPMTPDPNSDLVSEIEALLRSSPLRRKEREEKEAHNASNQSTPTQAKISEGAAAAVNSDDTPRQAQPPTFTRNVTQESLGSNSTNDTEFFTPVEGRTPFERPNPLDDVLPPPIPPKAARPQTPPVKTAGSNSSVHSTPTRPTIPTRRSSLSHSRNGSTETVPTKSYPPTSQRPGPHNRGKSIDSSSIYNDRGRTVPPPGQRQRSSSANAAGDDHLRGRGRSRSIDDGPPPIPARRSSVGKTGRPTALLQGLFGKKDEASASGSHRPSIAAANVVQRESDDSVEPGNINRFSFSSGLEVLGVGEEAEIVSADLVRSGSVKEILVRTGSKGSKPAEFPGASSSASSEAGKTKAVYPSQHVPQFSFGDVPDLSLGEGTSATNGKGKERARDQDVSTKPVVFQLIPPTPAADEISAVNKQLGFQPIPLALVDENGASSSSPLRKGTPNPLAGVPVVHVNSGSESTPSVPLPPRLPSVVNEIGGPRPSTAPEPLIDFDNNAPSANAPRRPSLKNMPTGFKKSKLSPWWRPKRSYDSRFHNYNDGYDEEHEYYDYRPYTAGVTSDGASSRRKKPRTVSLGKVQVEFVGVKWLRESLKERKEVKKRRKALQDVHFQRHTPVVDAGPPRLELRL